MKDDFFIGQPGSRYYRELQKCPFPQGLARDFQVNDIFLDQKLRNTLVHVQ